jgi:hypothetical protein
MQGMLCRRSVSSPVPEAELPCRARRRLSCGSRAAARARWARGPRSRAARAQGARTIFLVAAGTFNLVCIALIYCSYINTCSLC